MSNLLTSESKLKEIYAHPVGHDIIHRILTTLKLKDTLVTNPIVGNMRLQMLSGLIKKNLGDYEFLLTLLNTEQDRPAADDRNINETWWKEAVFYQIYPRSFMDADGDGIGDLKGIISKLDYLKELGVDALWLSPVYDSPNDDNGYDIRDYYQIMQDFGTMEDFDRLLEEVHSRDMRLIMDLVINHTSDEHKWFQEALHNPESKYRNYYHFRPGNGGKTPPNNWNSFFSGSAWNYYPEQDVWALHLFSKKQMDLNWDCKELREDILEMIRWWLNKGTDGFRMDVINYISKVEGLPDGNETIGEMIGYLGIENYFYGPHLHEYLREIRRDAFDPYNAYSVGEMPGIGMEMGKLLTGDDRRELDMMFSFDHLETPGHDRFDDYKYDLNFLKEYLIDYTEHYGSRCQLALFYNNHDNPKFLSKVDPDGIYRKELAKMLAVIQLTSRGTPYIYQGDELGAANQHFKSVDELRDVESLNLYEQLVNERKMTKEKAFEKVLAGTRDHARVPMQWSTGKNGGFTKGAAWIDGDRDYAVYNAEEEGKDDSSVLHFYKELLQLRKSDQTFAYGSTEFVKKHVKGFFLYYRIYQGRCYFIECNLTAKTKERFVDTRKFKLLLSNYGKPGNDMLPYEANIYEA